MYYILNSLRNRLGAMANRFLPPKQEVFKGSDDSSINVILVGLRWDYGSHLNGDGNRISASADNKAH